MVKQGFYMHLSGEQGYGWKISEDARFNRDEHLKKIINFSQETERLDNLFVTQSDLPGFLYLSSKDG